MGYANLSEFQRRMRIALYETDLAAWEARKLQGEDAPPPKKPNFDPPNHDFGAHLILRAFNVIVRARRYENCAPLPLCIEDIQAYAGSYDLPVEMGLFIECIFCLDDLALEKAHKDLEREAARARARKR